jgi:hypothetical protein
MAWFYFKCPEHGKFKVSLPKRTKTVKCPKCSQESKNILSVGTARVVEEIDTGTMSRKVEQLKDIQEIIDERERKFR